MFQAIERCSDDTTYMESMSPLKISMRRRRRMPRIKADEREREKEKKTRREKEEIVAIVSKRIKVYFIRHTGNED